MDMMTIILLFLISSFSSDIIIAPSETLKIPTTKRREKPKKETTVIAGKDMILFQKDTPVMPTQDALNSNELLLQPLQDFLLEEATKAKDLEAKYGKEFTREVLVQMDQALQFKLLVKILYTCGQSEFTKMRLMASQDPKAGGY
jgi:biopolymer transport protein ExbD